MAIIVDSQFAKVSNGVQSGVNQFYARQMLSGEWACDDNSDEEFPELFEGTSFEKRTLTWEDFPQSEDI